jgi:hypothetical protein
LPIRKLVAEPGHLPLGVAARLPFRGLNRVGQRYFLPQHGREFPDADGFHDR